MIFTGLIIECMVGSLAEAQVCVNPDGEKRSRVWTEGMDLTQFSAPAAGGLRRTTCGGI